MVHSDLRAVEPGRRRLPLVLTNARNVVAYPCRALAQAGSASCSFSSTVRRRRRHRRLAREHDQPPGGYARRRAAASNGGRLSPASGETLFKIQAAAGQLGAEIGGSGNCGNLTTPGIEVRYAASKTGSGNCENCGNRSGAGLERASAVMLPSCCHPPGNWKQTTFGGNAAGGRALFRSLWKYRLPPPALFR